jgi:transcription-repair coupling factor (superfamily II helicase)
MSVVRCIAVYLLLATCASCRRHAREKHPHNFHQGEERSSNVAVLSTASGGDEQVSNTFENRCCTAPVIQALASALLAHTPNRVLPVAENGLNRFVPVVATATISRPDTAKTPARIVEGNWSDELEQLPQLPTAPNSKSIQIGDYVVHSKKGVCQFMGIFDFKTTKGNTWKMVKLNFDDGYVQIKPKEAKQCLSLFKRRRAAAKNPPQLDSCTGTSWLRKKEKACKKAFAYAVELVEVAKVRQDPNRKRRPCPPDDQRMQDFEKAFQYVPTQDQLETFAAIAEAGRNLRRF